MTGYPQRQPYQQKARVVREAFKALANKTTNPRVMTAAMVFVVPASDEDLDYLRRLLK